MFEPTAGLLVKNNKVEICKEKPIVAVYKGFLPGKSEKSQSSPNT